MSKRLKQLEQELEDENWLIRASALRTLMSLNVQAKPALPTIFKLLEDEAAPSRCVSRRLIQQLGVEVVPFLLSKTRSSSALDRSHAVFSLSEVGPRWRTSTSMKELLLEPRKETLPTWGEFGDSVIYTFRLMLADEDLTVRYQAAIALEEFGVGLPKTVPVLIESLQHGMQHGMQHQKFWSALHLGRLGQLAKAAIQVFEEADSDEDTARAASNAIDLILKK